MDVVTHSILPFVLILLGLVVVHEAGHYITAKIFGVKVLEAGIGFPPRVWGFKYKDTDYTLNLLPLGAFVRLLGEEDPSDPESLAAQPKWKRTVIIGAGAFMNLVLAIALFSGGLIIPHRISTGGAAIGSVVPNSPAARQDLRAGDQILKVNGRNVQSTQDASYLLHLYQGSTIDLTLKRSDARTGAEAVTKSVYSRWNPGTYKDECGVDQPVGPIGISIGPAHSQKISSTAADRVKAEAGAKKAASDYKKDVASGSPAFCYAGASFGFTPLTAAQCDDLAPDARATAQALKTELFSESSSPCFTFTAPDAIDVPSVVESQPPWEAIPHGARLSYESLILARNQIWQWVRGFVSPQVTGPVGIAQATGEVVHQAGWLSLINFAALLSMNLAVLNVLPIPMFDGGRLVFILIEFLRRGRRIAPEKEALVHLTGLALILTLSVVITYFDVLRIFNGDSLLR
ncbi:MAG: site-2 protease family protein [Chloroflexota bacterium]|nr:site-2 protease family protein [Chloroflexota bacterium]